MSPRPRNLRKLRGLTPFEKSKSRELSTPPPSTVNTIISSSVAYVCRQYSDQPAHSAIRSLTNTVISAVPYHNPDQVTSQHAGICKLLSFVFASPASQTVYSFHSFIHSSSLYAMAGIAVANAATTAQSTRSHRVHTRKVHAKASSTTSSRGSGNSRASPGSRPKAKHGLYKIWHRNVCPELRLAYDAIYGTPLYGSLSFSALRTQSRFQIMKCSLRSRFDGQCKL